MLNKFKNIVLAIPKWLGFYLALCGIWGFSAFIFEESIQTSMFSTWQAIPAEQWSLVKKSIKTMEWSRNAMVTINNCGGQINPFGYLSYVAYGKASQDYIDSLKARVFANAPELFDGEVITFEFSPQETLIENDYFIIRNNNINILSNTENIPRLITGRVKAKDSKIFIDLRKK